MQYGAIEVAREEQIAASTDMQHLALKCWYQRTKLFLVVILHITFSFHIHAERVVNKQTIVFIFFHTEKGC